MTVQHALRNPSNINDLQESLDAYLGQRVEFADLRTRWITSLSDNPEMRSDAVRLLYRQPSNELLTEDQKLSLKRVAEAALHDDHDDWTDVLFNDEEPASGAVDICDNVALVDSIDAVSGKVISSPILADTSDPADQSPEPLSALRKTSNLEALIPGRILSDRFVLETPLGIGGMGVVYRARDRLRQSAVGGSARVALKILREEYGARPELVNALQHEALQTQFLSHPNIVRVYDFHKDGESCFLTMELLEGELLKTTISRTQPAGIERERAMQIIAGMCSGIAHARSKGLVHGDFKPSNVFLTNGDEPKILDFGVARVAASDDQTTAASGNAAIQEITPAYASCSRLEHGVPTFADDVYSLSCVIYELLAGHHPYNRKSALTARHLKLKPKPIDGLTKIQWSTLATGLELSSEDRTTEVFHLQTVFTEKPAEQSPELPAAIKTVATKGRRNLAARPAIKLFLLGVGIAAGILLFRTLPAPSDFVDTIRDAELVQIVRSMFDKSTKEPAMSEKLTSPDALAHVMSTPGAVDSSIPVPTGDVTANALNANAPAIQVLDTSSFLLNSVSFVLENAASVEVQIERQGELSNEASVEWSTFAGSAEPQTDYINVFRHPVYFAAGEKTKSVFVSVVSDSKVENDEDFQVVVTAPGGSLISTQLTARTITIVDDDA